MLSLQSVGTLLDIYYAYFSDLSVFRFCSPSTSRFHVCVFADVFLHTTVVTRGYLIYCHLPGNLNHPDVWSEEELNLLTMSAFFYALSCCHM